MIRLKELLKIILPNNFDLLTLTHDKCQIILPHWCMIPKKLDVHSYTGDIYEAHGNLSVIRFVVNQSPVNWLALGA